jgi:hypothetical protein
MSLKMGQKLSDDFPADLSRYLAAYREGLPDQEPGAHFMPRIWEAIDARQKLTYSFGRLARAFVSAAAVLCLVLSTLMPDNGVSPVYTTTYLEVLADHGIEEPDLGVEAVTETL